MMENKKFEVGQFWADAHGNKYMITDIKEDKMLVYDYAYESIKDFSLEGRYDWGGGWIALFTPWKEPISGEVLVNVYRTGDEIFYLAEENGHYVPLPSGRNLVNAVQLARIKMPWKEGQFDD